MSELYFTPTVPERFHLTSSRRPFRRLLLLLSLWLAVFAASLWTPPLLDDADATHAQAAQAMARTGDWVTLHVDGVRYLEKAPLPYWLAAFSLKIFGANSFAIHLPLALAVLALAGLGYAWARRAFGERTAFYTALFILTSCGVFLFTRIFIPEVLLSLFLFFGLYFLLRALEIAGSNLLSSQPKYGSVSAMRSGGTSVFASASHHTEIVCPPKPLHAYFFWSAMALAVLTKGMVAIVFLLGTAVIFLILTGELRHWRRLRPASGLMLFLLIAAPWHILAGLRNAHGSDGHGFFWLYFINEHFLRFLGRRMPRDYNKLPGYLYWSLHLVWLFPWSLLAPAALVVAWRKRRNLLQPRNQTERSVLLLTIFSALVVLFFSVSTNQEYYTFPVYLPLLMLMAAALVRAEQDTTMRRAITVAHASFAVLGLTIAALLGYGLWTSRQMSFVADIGEVLAHRGIGQYTLSMSHFFDLTGPSFAALRLPASIALVAFVIGPLIAWLLRVRRKHFASTVTIALTSAAFLIAAHLALARFTPLLCSRDFAIRIQSLEQTGAISRANQVMIYGDQSFGSSIPFYLDRSVSLVDGRTTSMLFGSTFPDAPPIFLTPQDLLANWGLGTRKLLFVPLERRDEVNRLLGARALLLYGASGKVLLTDRPLDTRAPESGGKRALTAFDPNFDHQSLAP